MKQVVAAVKKQFQIFGDTLYDTFIKGGSFAFWGLLVLLLNFVMFHAVGFNSDIQYWRGWVTSLQMGFDNFNGDYPPAYIWWLRIVAAFYKVTGLSLKMDYELKVFCLFPVVLAHISLAHFVWLRLRNRQWAPQLKTVAMLLVVVNPAFYLDGPVWGQVDILPVTICVWALWFASKPKTFALGIGLFMLGLLTKFQMIMFLPVFGALALRYRKIMWKGLLSAGLVFLIVFLPFIVAGNFVSEFSHAYLSSVGQYPYAAFNAGNLWMMLVGNMTPDTRPIFEWAPAFLNPSLLGKLLFVVVSFGVLVVCFFKRLGVASLMQFASLNALAFFMLLPCMHERYAMAAAAMYVGAVSCQKKPKFAAAVLISGIAYLNIAMLSGVRGSDMWFWISVVGIVSLIYFLVQSFAPKATELAINKLLALRIPSIVAYGALVLFYVGSATVCLVQSERSFYKLKDNEMFVYDLHLIHQKQGYGSTRIGSTVDGNPLRIKGVLYMAGLGIHSPSTHVYELPEGAVRFTVSCGVDDEAGSGKMEFIIKLDNREVWRSGEMKGDEIKTADIDVRGARRIFLVTDELGTNSYDHGDWVNPVVHLEK